MENDNFEVITWHVAHSNAKKGEKITFDLAGNFAITYSGKAIKQSEVIYSSNIEDMDFKLVSNDAAG